MAQQVYRDVSILHRQGIVLEIESGETRRAVTLLKLNRLENVAIDASPSVRNKLGTLVTKVPVSVFMFAKPRTRACFAAPRALRKGGGSTVPVC